LIEWIPLIGAGASLLGSLFGNQKDTDKTENSSSQTSTASTAKVAGSNATTQTQNQVQNQNSVQNSTQDTAQDQLSSQVGQTTRLDEDTVGLLTKIVQDSLSGGINQGSEAAKLRLREIQNTSGAFDSDKYVKGIMGAAESAIGESTKTAKNIAESRVGARTTSNSAAALLAGKIDRAAGAELGGIRAQAEATAAELQRSKEESKTGQITQLAANTNADVSAILGALLQAGEKSTLSANQTGKTIMSGGTTGNTSTTTQQQMAENSTQQQTQSQVDTGAQQTKGNISQKEGSTNWSDFFTNVGKIFTAQF